MWPLVVRHHMSRVRPSSREKNFFCGPIFVLWLFLQVLKISQCRGGAVEIFNWHFKFYTWSIDDIKWWACRIRRVADSSADSLGWAVVGATWPSVAAWPSEAA
jgi:hypothetical protein